MNYYYAQLNGAGVVVSVTQVTEVLDAPHLIAIAALDHALLGQVYDAPASAAAGQPVFVAPPAVPAAPDDRMWWVDVGPFYDRFGPDALAIAASDHGACRAVQTLTGVRKYIDLKDPRVADMIDMLIATGQPTAQPWAPGSGPMTVEKKAAILEAATTEYERHIKGLVPQQGLEG